MSKFDQLPRVSLLRKFGWAVGGLAIITTAFFTNCDGGFKYDAATGNLESLDSTRPDINSGDLKITVFNSSGMIVSGGQSLEGGTQYKLVATGINLKEENAEENFMWQILENTAGCALETASATTRINDTRYLRCELSGRISLEVSAVGQMGTRLTASEYRTTSAIAGPGDTCGMSTPDRVVFRIPSGTGVSPWNSSTSPVSVAVGQVLRICNNDRIPHRLHTGGNPCPHQPSQSRPGEFYDCPVTSKNGVNSAGIIAAYDHDLGTNSTFYIRIVDAP